MKCGNACTPESNWARWENSVPTIVSTDIVLLCAIIPLIRVILGGGCEPQRDVIRLTRLYSNYSPTEWTKRAYRLTRNQLQLPGLFTLFLVQKGACVGLWKQKLVRLNCAVAGVLAVQVKGTPIRSTQPTLKRSIWSVAREVWFFAFGWYQLEVFTISPYSEPNLWLKITIRLTVLHLPIGLFVWK